VLSKVAITLCSTNSSTATENEDGKQREFTQCLNPKNKNLNRNTKGRNWFFA